MIDWQPIAEHLHFTTPKEMLESLYQSVGGQKKIGDYLGISHRTVGMKMKELGVVIKGPGGANNRVSKVLCKLRSITTEEYTARELASVCDCILGTLYNICNAHSIPYKRSSPCPDADDQHDFRHLQELRARLNGLSSTT